MVSDTGVAPDRTAFMGDDLPDLPLMRRVGLSIAVADAHESVREFADWVTSAPGGHGAVREVCDALLKAQGHWDWILEKY
jgi:3-deoxy-D-manno-octulosonate 8-phosphate phosphatase (KDO 8-P phosphatase)